MKIILSKRAINFLESVSSKDKERIKRKINTLLFSITENNIIPYKQFDLKNLEGEWQGFLRLRIGKIRIIFRIDRENDEMLIYGIDFRGNIYK